MAEIIDGIVGDRRLLGGIAGSIALFIIACCGCFLLFPTADEPEADEEVARKSREIEPGSPEY